MVIGRAIRYLVCAVVLWVGLVLPSVAGIGDLLPNHARELMYDQFRQSALNGAKMRIEANRFLSREKEDIFIRFSERLFNDTQVVPVMVDDMFATYGADMMRQPTPELQAQMINHVGIVFGKIAMAGLTYLSDDDRSLMLKQQMEVMERLDPKYCVLYANAQTSLDTIAKNAEANGAFLQTMSNEEVQAILDTHLNIMSLGALHQAKPRTMTRAQHDAMVDAFADTLVAWVETFDPKDQALFTEYLFDETSQISERDECAINISLTQMALEAEGKAGEQVRLALLLGLFDERELVSK